MTDYKDSTVRSATSASLSIPIRNTCIVLTPDLLDLRLMYTPWLAACRQRKAVVWWGKRQCVNERKYTRERRNGFIYIDTDRLLHCTLDGGRHSSVDIVPRLESKRPQFDSRRGQRFLCFRYSLQTSSGFH